MRNLTLAFIFVLFIFAATASAQKSRFVGNFVSENPNTNGITRVTIYDDDTVRVWGQCLPNDCDWGEETAFAYSPNVGTDTRDGAKALTVTYVKNFAVTILIIRPVKDKLLVESFTRFTDRSGRAAHTYNEILVREGTTVY